MLSDEEKKEMLEDARSESRRKEFALSRKRVLNQTMTWTDYFHFLDSAQKLFPQQKFPKKIEGNAFKL